jgi:hypothetical protein
MRRQYWAQKSNAKRRGIPFLLTYEQWYGIWKRSGHLSDRGKGTDRYCMARFHDRGAYEIGNVHIITHQQNARDKAPFSETTKQKMSVAAKLRIQRMPLHMRKMRAARGGNSAEVRLKISRSNKGRIGGFTGKRHSEATKALKRRTWRNQFGSAGAQQPCQD